MNDWQKIKDRFVRHPITTVLGLVGGIALAVAMGGSAVSIIAGVCTAITGALFKDPQFPSGGMPA